jgi:hypothetical protein
MSEKQSGLGAFVRHGKAEEAPAQKPDSRTKPTVSMTYRAKRANWELINNYVTSQGPNYSFQQLVTDGINAVFTKAGMRPLE